MSGSLQPAASPEQLAELQMRLWELLSQRAARYTMGESTSLPVPLAQELLASICFTLGIDEEHPAASAARLSGRDLAKQFERGERTIRAKLGCARRRYDAVCQTLPDLGSRSLTDTLAGMDAFWKRYDHRFFAHQIPCGIDYQLIRPVPETVLGVDSVAEYLRRLQLENGFLRRFDARLCVRLLEACCPDYRGLPVNLCEPVAVNAIGLTLLGREAAGLDITPGQRREIERRLGRLPRREAGEALLGAAERLCSALGLGEASRRYFGALARELVPRIRASREGEGVFLSI